jgi:putative two-component system response regulator
MKHLLFVDDEPRILDGLRRTLRPQQEIWTCHFATSVDEAWEKIEGQPLDVVVSDINMPGKNGLSLLEKIKNSEEHKYTPVLMLTGNGDGNVKRRALDLGAADFLQKPCDPVEMLARLQNVIALKTFQDEIRRQNAHLEEVVRCRTQELEASRREIIFCLAKAAETRDSDTGNHIVRVALYSRLLAEALNLDVKTQEAILLASPLHDVGKIGIEDQILRKPGPLTMEERAEMQRHCQIGANILKAELEPTFAALAKLDGRTALTSSTNELLELAGRIALFHHERWDGTGYPLGLKGDEIPLEARIVSVCDVFDALRASRPYKDPMSMDITIEVIQKQSGLQFDPAIVDAFLSRVDEFEEIRRNLDDSTEWMSEAA